MQAINDGDLRPEQVAIIARTLDIPEQDVISMNGRLAARDHSLNATIRQDSEGEWLDSLPHEADSQEAIIGERQELLPAQDLAFLRLDQAEPSGAPHHSRALAQG